MKNYQIPVAICIIEQHLHFHIKLGCCKWDIVQNKEDTDYQMIFDTGGIFYSALICALAEQKFEVAFRGINRMVVE